MSPLIFSTKFHHLIIILLLFSLLVSNINCIRVQGIWSPSSNLYKVITRFGFQKTDPNHRLETAGYIFGNVTLINDNDDIQYDRNVNPLYHGGVLLFANKTLLKFIHGLHSRLQSNDSQFNVEDEFCEQIFQTIHDKNFDEKCDKLAPKNDFIRYIPCSNDKTCDDPYQTITMPNSQLTFVIDDIKDALFWYPVLLPCERVFDANLTNCYWKRTNMKMILSYDLWLVNGHPNSISNRIIDFDYQFSYEQPSLWIYIAATIGYIILFIIQIYALSKQKLRNLNYLFTASLLLHTLSYSFISLHKIVFAHDGQGFETLGTVAEVLRLISIVLLMLFVVIIAKGWPFTKPELISKTMLIVWTTLYLFSKIALYIWLKNSLDLFDEIDEYHTEAAWISLGLRLCLMSYFIYELRHTMMLEQDSRKLKFYLHFGAGMLVWFVHLPLVAIVALHINLMWRYKIIAGFSSMADFLAYAILTRMMWDTKNKLFLIPDSDIDFNEELEYYDDNNSFVASETFKFSHANHRPKHLYDNHAVCDNVAIKT